MEFAINHVNINVTDLAKSKAFYEKALGLRETRNKKDENGAFELAFLTDKEGAFFLELTWLQEKQGKYDLGDNETHIAFKTDDFARAHELHSQMGCICFENSAMGIYFIEDPDGYWLEIVPTR